LRSPNSARGARVIVPADQRPPPDVRTLLRSSRCGRGGSMNRP
jgi:hypothetical protein